MEKTITWEQAAELQSKFIKLEEDVEYILDIKTAQLIQKLVPVKDAQGNEHAETKVVYTAVVQAVNGKTTEKIFETYSKRLLVELREVYGTEPLAFPISLKIIAKGKGIGRQYMVQRVY
jgi:hypothetical protein